MVTNNPKEIEKYVAKIEDDIFCEGTQDIAPISPWTRIKPKYLLYKRKEIPRERCGLLMFYNGLFFLTLVPTIFLMSIYYFFQYRASSVSDAIIMFVGAFTAAFLVIGALILLGAFLSLLSDRMHDLNFSEKWLSSILFFPPLILIYVVIGLLIPGKNEDNQYGPPSPQGYPIGIIFFIIIFIAKDTLITIINSL